MSNKAAATKLHKIYQEIRLSNNNNSQKKYIKHFHETLQSALSNNSLDFLDAQKHVKWLLTQNLTSSFMLSQINDNQISQDSVIKTLDIYVKNYLQDYTKFDDEDKLYLVDYGSAICRPLLKPNTLSYLARVLSHLYKRQNPEQTQELINLTYLNLLPGSISHIVSPLGYEKRKKYYDTACKKIGYRMNDASKARLFLSCFAELIARKFDQSALQESEGKNIFNDLIAILLSDHSLLDQVMSHSPQAIKNIFLQNVYVNDELLKSNVSEFLHLCAVERAKKEASLINKTINKADKLDTISSTDQKDLKRVMKI